MSTTNANGGGDRPCERAAATDTRGSTFASEVAASKQASWPLRDGVELALAVPSVPEAGVNTLERISSSAGLLAVERQPRTEA